MQSSIDIKRNSTQIVDGLSAEEIGAIPALSIGAALETITGATSHRENGGATELSVRGLGPFLGTTVVQQQLAVVEHAVGTQHLLVRIVFAGLNQGHRPVNFDLSSINDDFA